MISAEEEPKPVEIRINSTLTLKNNEMTLVKTIKVDQA